jgi:hypothetical protein
MRLRSPLRILPDDHHWRRHKQNQNQDILQHDTASLPVK